MNNQLASEDEYAYIATPINGATVLYGSASELRATLDYDFSEENLMQPINTDKGRFMQNLLHRNKSAKITNHKYAKVMSN